MNRKIKVGIVGMGRIGRSGHVDELAAYPEKFELTAFADNAPDRRMNPPEALKNARSYASLDELLADGEVEMVTIATRHRDHVPMTIKSLEAGKYVVNEKPVATGVAEMHELKKCSDRYPGKLFLRHNRRFEAPFVKARELIASGLLGEVNYIKLYRSVGYCRRNDWLTMREFHGGLLTNWGPHLLDQALRLLDGKVVDLWSDVRHMISVGDGDDMFKIIMKADNGRLADVEVSGANALPGREMEIIGTRGTLIYPADGKILVRMVDPSIEFKPLAPHPENPPLSYGNFEESLSFVESRYDIPPIPNSIGWSHIYDAITGVKPYEVKFEEAMEVVRITEEALRSNGFA